MEAKLERDFNGRLIVRIQIGKGKGATSYKNEINLLDWKQLALLLSDLELNGAKIDKAYTEYRKNKRETWPF